MSKPGIIKPEIRYLLYFAVFWVVLLAAVTHFFGSWDSQQNNPNQQLVSQTRGSVTEIELQANRQGHYLANGTINNQRVTFILDTGATTVAVSESLAQKAGLRKGQSGRAHTAAGTVNVWSTTIQELRLGDMTFYNVPGTINPAMDPDMVLLGMSVLGQLNFSQQSGVLTLSQDNR
ncbi:MULTISPECIES: retropepsin-like aspartic protease family protein [Marinobacter]|jgi:aspartyl protease family protein|uniref:Retroviral aspartyl protease domain protein n=1 Tax=Marinobacter excellens LAMA 842 TaxID=1306954 RepID=A0A137S1M8_9GAMM|nr:MULTISPECIES: TIGR02281 family clan AA aspartic protease [Marinobacter]KXO06328.1 Retroviral aspartyl protease domain protein [Marinobacter excellens LAMA 842]MCD1632004.1 TIGR02281 family clan AA aspartic protease [Marinobacter shengliensis]